jgi:hypothetical protein
MAAFEYGQAQEIRDAFARHGCRYLFLGKAGAILLGFPDTTQDAQTYAQESVRTDRAPCAVQRTPRVQPSSSESSSPLPLPGCS